MAVLPDDQIRRLHTAILTAHLTDNRRALLGGINAVFVAGLPTAPDPSGQIFSDLHRLNAVERLADRTVPLQTWLENALTLAGQRVERDAIFAALEATKSREAAPRACAHHDHPSGAELVSPGVTALHQLRAPPADFTGRAEELADLLEKMGTGGVTISGLYGQGGVGKTALALKLAQALAPSYLDAQIDVDLKGVSSAPLSPASVMVHAIRAFQPAAKLPETDAELAVLYRSVLHGKRVLLLFDNARDRAQIEPLLPPPGCLVIITSRQRFTLSGLHARSLDQLEHQDAVALLQKIAPRLDAGSAATVAHLCGYLPLSLRVAASALAERVDLEPEEYSEDLRSAQVRLDWVDASLSLSFDLLNARLQVLWSQLGVFPGDFDREAAATVGELESGVTRNMLSDLVKHSMVEYNPVTKRYKLHDLARLYAVSRLGGADRYAAERRHAEHFRIVAARADDLYKNGGKSITAGLELFDREWENIEAGQAWASAHAVETAIDAYLCSDYPIAGAYCLALRQHPRERIHWHDIALAAARRLGRRKEECVHLNHMGLAYSDLGELGRGLELFEQALPIFREIGDRKSESEALSNLGVVYAMLGDVHRAIALYEQSLVITREIGHRQGEGTVLGDMANAHAMQGDVHRAIALYEQSLVITREIGHRQGEGTVLGDMANAYAMLGDVYRAIALYEQCLGITREIGHRQGEAIASWNLGLSYEALGESEKAIAAMQVRVDYERTIGHPDAEKDAVLVDKLRARRDG